MKWIGYLGASPARDVPGVGDMVRGEPVLLEDEVADRLLASPLFGEFTPSATAAASPAEAEKED